MEKTYFLLHGPKKKLGDCLLGHLWSMQGSSYIVILSFDAEQMLTTQVSRTAFPDRPGNWKNTNFVSNIVLTKEENFFIVLILFCFNFVSTFLVISFMWLSRLVPHCIHLNRDFVEKYKHSSNSIHYFSFYRKIVFILLNF